MALSICESTTNSQGMELIQHGSVAFPIACYEDDLNQTDVPWHWHEELELVYIDSGVVELSVADSNATHTLSAGEGFFINAGHLHSVRAAHDTFVAHDTPETFRTHVVLKTPESDFAAHAYTLHSVVFHPRLIGGGIDSIFWQKYILPLTQNEQLSYVLLSPDVGWQSEILKLIDQTWHAMIKEEAGYELNIRTDLSKILFYFNTHYLSSVIMPNTRELRQAERIKQMLQFIHTNYAENIGTDEIARSISLSTSECLRCFRNTIKTTPIQYLNEYRIQKAARLLQTTDDKISEIAFSCGFREMSYFARMFRRQMGITPSEYRKLAFTETNC